LDAERLLEVGKVLYKQSLAKDGASKETNQKGFLIFLRGFEREQVELLRTPVTF